MRFCVFHTYVGFFIKNHMEENFDDELMPSNFEKIARAYSKAIKTKKFVFVNLEKEEFNFLVNEVLVLLSKMQACLTHLKKYVECDFLEKTLCEVLSSFCNKFNKKTPHKFNCVANENSAFLCLVGLENTLVLKLMLLALKSEEIELCQNAIASISSVFAESLSIECFVLAD